MPIKELSSPFARDGVSQGSFKFGGGAEVVFTANGAFPFGYIIDTGGSDDVIYGSDIGAAGSGIGDVLTGGDGSDTIYGGGGDDTILGGNADGSDSSKGQNAAPTNLLVGDGERLTTDPFSAYSEDVNFLNGVIVFNGGNDTITGGDGATSNNIYGDAADVNMATGADFTGGNDNLMGGDNDGGVLIDGINLPQNNIYGDADNLMLGQDADFTGGVDNITGGTNADNSLYGDAFWVTFSGDGAVFNGGDDVIKGGDGSLAANDLFGDAQTVIFNDHSVTFNGGDDTLISGTGASDVMRGDAVLLVGAGNATIIGGADTFVFAPNNGRDTILDFHTADGDKVDLSAFGFTSYDDLDPFWTNVFGDQALDFDGDGNGFGNVVIFDNIAFDADPDVIVGLGAGDFIFASV
jgi:Ca2+-binding RTX toxin-like protein